MISVSLLLPACKDGAQEGAAQPGLRSSTVPSAHGGCPEASPVSATVLTAATLMEWLSLGQGCDQPWFFTLRLEVETDQDRGMVFYAVASDLLPARPFNGVSISHTDGCGCFVLLCCRENSELCAHGFENAP